MRNVITDIPIPVVLHSFFSLYFFFSSFEAILYPEINQLPCPEIKTMESIANIIKLIHMIQSGPVDISANFIYDASTVSGFSIPEIRFYFPLISILSKIPCMLIF